MSKKQDAKENSFMTIQDSPNGGVAVPAANTNEVSDLGALFDGHIAREFADF
jgi:hypothetical protein